MNGLFNTQAWLVHMLAGCRAGAPARRAVQRRVARGHRFRLASHGGLIYERLLPDGALEFGRRIRSHCRRPAELKRTRSDARRVPQIERRFEVDEERGEAVCQANHLNLREPRCRC
jgi:hypothetical protein